ncbi:hypothetical protein [Kosakonia calanthes]|uniref:hypothetical protein n=1 Tax=Kosakonia calanthes TaxID=3139408 RepID=UPI003CC7E4DE
MDFDIKMPNEVYLFIHDMHIAKSMQNNGIGTLVFYELLKKRTLLKMVVANQNVGMIALVNKFNVRNRFVTANVTYFEVDP